MEIHVLNAMPRGGRGRRAALALRRAGRIPAIVYGEGQEPQAVALDVREFETALRHHDRVFQLQVEGQQEKVLLHQIQWDPLGNHPHHVDFLRISHHAIVEVRVELEYIGHPKGLAKGGEFNKQMKDVLVVCAPEAIPTSIPVRVADLDVDMAIHVADLVLPPGVRVLAAPDALVCAVNLRGLEPEAAPAPAEGETSEPEVIGKGRKEEEEAAPEKEA